MNDPALSRPATAQLRSTAPELLAPAGNWDCAKAAVENGADAIYFGLDRFNARMRADNFTEADLPRLMEFLHRRGVKGYLTFNTLIFPNELDDARRYLRTVIAAGVDAAIVQDVGICRLIRSLSPDFPIHASTQMTITSAAGVEFARDLGCQLVVLARECSVREIEKIQSALSDSGSSKTEPSAGFPLEVFVHGALCVAYSGQCLTSESLGGRSANRGECAQACRMPYELISDGQSVPLGDRRYLLSPQDLAGIELLPQLARAGVVSLKIEGRLKSPEYVANITRVYRHALDLLAPRSPQGEAKQPESSKANPFDDLKRNSSYALEMAFSRGLHTGWLGGIDNQKLVHARFGKKRGVYLGAIQKVKNQKVLVQLAGPLKPGDGVVFDAGRPDEPEEGGRVYSVEPANANEAWLSFGTGELNFSKIHPRNRLWKTDDPMLNRELRQTFAGTQPQFQRPIQIDVHGRKGEPATIIARDELGHVAQAASKVPLAPAANQPLTEQRLREQLGRLGGTPFRLDTLENRLEGELILPVSELNRLRRELAEQLEQQRAQPKRWTLRPPCPIASLAPPRSDGSARNSAPEFVVLARSLDQLQATWDSGIRTIYCELEDPKQYRAAVARFRQLQSALPKNPSEAGTIWVAPPRIFKSGEEWILDIVRSSEADGYLVRNYDHLKFFSGARRRGDFSLNVANGLAAEYFLSRFGLERVTASYDLNFEQLHELAKSAPPDWFEVTVHQHMPMFHMEHCVFCAFLSSGTDYRNCGRPCDKHQVELRDRVGAKHPLKADAGCRNTVFNALAQTGAEHLSRMVALGLRHFRLEFLNETADQVQRTIAQYQRLLRGEITGAQLWRELKLLNQLGVTRGQLPG